MIRSRLRRPTSKSMTAVFLPALARPQARDALVVVLPTPPLPEVTTMISANGLLQPRRAALRGYGGSVELLDAELVMLEPDLHRLAEQVLRDFLEHLVVTGDRDQLGVELA